MKTAVVFTAISALLVVLTVPTRADQSKELAPDGPSAVVYDASSAFDFLAAMAGEWERASGGHDHGGKSKLTTFKVTAAGSSVLETIFPGESSEMLTIYHRDGDDLLLTHYCALHNAPVMKFLKSDKPGEIKFSFAGGTNFDPNVDMHVHEGSMQVKDANTVETTFITFSDGKAGPPLKGIMKRKQAK
jgi:hypothetical protein